MQLFMLLQTYNGVSIDISNGAGQCLVNSHHGKVTMGWIILTLLSAQGDYIII